MQSIDGVALLALVQYLWFGGLVGKARVQHGVKAPAITGHPVFERLYRVQMNTLELLVAFLPALYIAARYWPPHAVAAVGAVYLVGRLIYWRAYVADPSRRGLGFALSMAPVGILIGVALWGAVWPS